jgi:hypothetical protein
MQQFASVLAPMLLRERPESAAEIDPLVDLALSEVIAA